MLIYGLILPTVLHVQNHIFRSSLLPLSGNVVTWSFKQFIVYSMMLFFRGLAPCRLVGRCKRSILSPSLGVKMGTVCFSETLASTDKSTRHQNPEEKHHHPHCHKNLKSHIVYSFGQKFQTLQCSSIQQFLTQSV
jgi:hypothetical protein